MSYNSSCTSRGKFFHNPEFARTKASRLEINAMSRFGQLAFISFIIYMSYRIWWMGDRVAGPVVASSVCFVLLIALGGVVWWAWRYGDPKKQ